MKYKVYASISHVPEERSVKADLILVTNGEGKLVDYLPGPATIDGYEGRFTKNKAKESAKDWVNESLEIDTKIDDVRLVPYPRLSKMLFKLQNK